MTEMEKQNKKRMNFNCPEDLYWAAKEKAFRERQTLTDVLVKALQEYVSES